jgi:uncharacterized protein (TIGR00255 family)
MNSMTGYGRGEAVFKGLHVSVELSSVNRKQVEFNCVLPRELDSLETRIRDQLAPHVSRGRITFRLSVDYGQNRSGCRLQLNADLARQYVREIRRLGTLLKIDSSLSWDSLLRAPGIVEIHSPLEQPEALWNTIQKALKRSLSSFLATRAKEGAALARDLQARIAAIRLHASAVAKMAPLVATRYRDSLVNRLHSAGLPLPPDDERLIKEVVLFADRSDVSEELTRLSSHFDQFVDCLESQEPVGRKLDFLVQEMYREINTIGSKANDATMARHVVEMKAELERFREQAQNVE